MVLICSARDGGWHIGVIAVVRSQSRAAICYASPSFLRFPGLAVSPIKYNTSGGRDTRREKETHSPRHVSDPKELSAACGQSARSSLDCVVYVACERRRAGSRYGIHAEQTPDKSRPLIIPLREKKSRLSRGLTNPFPPSPAAVRYRARIVIRAVVEFS